MIEKVTISKFGGDDKLSWAVFVGQRPVVTGLSRDEAKWHKGVIERQLEGKGSD